MANERGSQGQHARKRRDQMDRECEKSASLYLRGHSYGQIAESLGCHIDTVRRHVKRARSLWRKRASKTYAKHLHEQMAKLDEIEAAAWIGWEKSLGDALETGTEDGTSPMGETSMTKVKRKRQSGNASFLKIVNDTVRQRSELLGLLDPDSRNAQQENGDVSVVSIVIDSREEAEEFQMLSLPDYREKVAVDAG